MSMDLTKLTIGEKISLIERLNKLREEEASPTIKNRYHDLIVRITESIK